MKLPLAEVRERLGKHPFVLLSDGPNGRVWNYLPTCQCVDDDEALAAVEDAENKRPPIDFQI
jgi:hypothetical protein